MELQVIEANEQYTHIKLIGRMDMEGTLEIDEKFGTQTTARRKPAIVDMSEVTFLASLGMRTIVSAAKGLKASNATMYLVAPQPMVKQALQMAGIDKVTPIVETADDAKAQIEG